MKNSSLRLVSQLHLRSLWSQSPRCLRNCRTRAAVGRWSSEFSREKGQTRTELSQRKRLTMNALHSLENRARVLFAQRISRVCHLVSEMLTQIGTPPKAFHNTHTSETKSPEEKKRMTCSTGALLCPQTLICLRHRLPPANVKCIVYFYSCFRDRSRWRTWYVPIAPSRGRSVEFPSEGNTDDQQRSVVFRH